MCKDGTAIPAADLPNGMYELVCCGFSKYEHTDSPTYKGWTTGIMVVRGNESSDCFAIELEMAVVLPQLHQGIPWICADDRGFSRLVDAYGAVWLFKEGNHFELRDGDGYFAGFILDKVVPMKGRCCLHS